MAPEKSERDIANFFRPYAQPIPPKTVPAKRPSPTPGDKQVEWTEPRTPLRASRFKDGLSSPSKSPFGPRSGASVTIPIRSPKPSPCKTPTRTLIPTSSALRSGRLFALPGTEKDQEREPLSFADIPTSAQRIVKDGKVIAVRSSDDEDSDSLCSLDDILGRNRRDVATESSSPPDVEDDLEALRVKSLCLFTNGRSNALIGRDKLRELTSKAKGLNFDIGLLVGDHFDDEEIEANVARAKQGYKASDDQEKLEAQGLIDKNILASVAGKNEGSGDMQRLFSAVERIDALATERTWSMFRSLPLLTPSSSAQPFPEYVTEFNSWLECLTDLNSRNRAYLSGYVAEKAAEGTVPDELTTWTFNCIAREPRDDLRKCYLQAVGAASPRWTYRNLTPSMIEQAFCQLGADPNMVKWANEIIPESKAPPDRNASLNNLLVSVIEMLLCLATDMAGKTLSVFFRLLMRIAIDTHMMSNSRVCVVVEDAVSLLLGHREERVSTTFAQCILKDIGLGVKDPCLQSHTLKHILPTSLAAASLRIRLAKLFLLGTTEEDSSDISNPENSLLQQLTTHLQDPRYNISRCGRHGAAFDYSTLSYLIYIFDTALADGGRPSSFSDAFSECEFNHQVDKLADCVKSIITSIADTGASHMRRTEAKEALNALHFRVLFGVRTQPRPKKSVFGGRDGGEHRAEERSAGIMQQFLGRRKEQKTLKERGAKLGTGQDSSLSPKSESEKLIKKQLGLGS